MAGLVLSDGGDGFAGVMKHYLRTETIECATVDPLGRPIIARYEWDARKNPPTAIIELASASGLALLQKSERSPLHTSTYGTGLLVRDAIRRGATRITLGLGGSATNDAGTGILAALGFEFRDRNGNSLTPSGKALGAIEHIFLPDSFPAIEFEIACDVQNPLYGPQGAAFVYAPQKGAGPVEVGELDVGLRHFARLVLRDTGQDIAHAPGSGAAGGVGAGLIGFFNVRFVSGIQLVMETSGIRSALAGTDWLVTGEGSLDAQTADGKVISELMRLGHAHRTPIVAFCGKVEPGLSEKALWQDLNVQVITPLGMSQKEAVAHSALLLEDKVRTFFRTQGKHR